MESLLQLQPPGAIANYLNKSIGGNAGGSRTCQAGKTADCFRGVGAVNNTVQPVGAGAGIRQGNAGGASKIPDSGGIVQGNSAATYANTYLKCGSPVYLQQAGGCGIVANGGIPVF